MDQEQTKPRRRWVKPVFIASLAVNLIVIGAIIGAGFGDHKRHGYGLKAPHGVRSYVSALTQDQRREFRQNSEHSLSDGLKTLRKLRGGHQDVLAAIEATPFSEEALRAAMDKQLVDVASIMSEFQNELIATLSAMNDGERAAYAQRLKDQRKHRWKKNRQ